MSTNSLVELQFFRWEYPCTGCTHRNACIEHTWHSLAAGFDKLRTVCAWNRYCSVDCSQSSELVKKVRTSICIAHTVYYTPLTRCRHWTNRQAGQAPPTACTHRPLWQPAISLLYSVLYCVYFILAINSVCVCVWAQRPDHRPWTASSSKVSTSVTHN